MYNVNNMLKNNMGRMNNPPSYVKQRIEVREIWLSSITQSECAALFIGDSMIKYVDNVNDTLVMAFKGIKMSQLGARFYYDKIPQIYGKRLCILNAGTNNIVSDSPEEILNQVHFTIKAIRHLVPDINIAVTEVLPRPCDHDSTGQDVKQVNSLLSQKSTEWNFHIIPSSRPFTHDTWPKDELFAKDGLHLSSEGTAVFRGYVKRVLGHIRATIGIPRSTTTPPPTMIWCKINKA